MKPTLVIAAILSILLVVFAISNNYLVEVNFLFTRIKVSMPVLLFSAFGLGILTSVLYNLPSWWRNRSFKKSIAKENESLKAQIQELNRLSGQNKDINVSDVDDFVKDVDKE